MNLPLLIAASGLVLVAGAQTNGVDPATSLAPPAAAVAQNPRTNPAISTDALVATNVLTATNAPAEKDPVIDIVSDSFVWHYGDPTARIGVFTGNVRAEEPRMKLVCESLMIRMPRSGRPNLLVAETNVVIDGLDYEGNPFRATAEKATYTYKVEDGVTNENIALTEGNPRVESESFTQTADLIVLDLITKTFRSTETRTTLRTDTPSDPTNGSSNAPPANSQP